MKTYLLFCLALIYCTTTLAQLSIDSPGTNYTIDFDNSVNGINNGPFAGTGFSPTPAAGQLNSNGLIASGLSDGDLNFGASNIADDFARGNSTGGVGTGGIYSFETSTGNFALGFQPGGSDFTPGSFTIKVLNNTGNDIGAISISYDVLVYNDQDRGNSFNFSYSTDNIVYYNVSELNLTSPADKDASPSWVNTNKNTSISETITNGTYLYIRWNSDDVNGSYTRDEFGLDNIVINASLANTLSNTKENFSLYPIPFNKFLNLKANNIESVALISLTGKTIYINENVSEKEITIPTDNLSKGIYLVKVLKTDGTIITKKIVKK